MIEPVSFHLPGLNAVYANVGTCTAIAKEKISRTLFNAMKSPRD